MTEIDLKTVKMVSRLASIKLTESEEKVMCSELEAILQSIKTLRSVVVPEGTEPLVNISADASHSTPMDEDIVLSNECSVPELLSNSPGGYKDLGFFVVPKVIE